MELEWSTLLDRIPNSDSKAALWVTFDGEVHDSSGDPAPHRSPLRSAPSTAFVLGQKARRVGSSGIARLRQQTRDLFEAHGEAIAAMPAFDGIGRLGDESMFTWLLDLLAKGDQNLIEPEHQHQSRASAAAGGTAALIYIAEQASDPKLRAAALKVAVGYYDFGVGKLQGMRRGTVRPSLRRAVDRDVRDILEGFAWPGDQG